MDFASKTDIKALSADITAALEAVAEKHGITLKSTGGTYDPYAGTYKPRVEFAASDSAEREFARYADMLGLSPAHFGAVFTTAGQDYMVVGLNMRAQKRPVICERGDGKTFVFPAGDVAKLLAGKVAQ